MPSECQLGLPLIRIAFGDFNDRAFNCFFVFLVFFFPGWWWGGGGGGENVGTMLVYPVRFLRIASYFPNNYFQVLGRVSEQ